MVPSILLATCLLIFALLIFFESFSSDSHRMCDNFTKEIFKVEPTEVVPAKIREMYQRQTAGRKALLDSFGSSSTNYANLYNVAAPEVLCPGLVRIGHLSDGGKWICSPHLLPRPCVIYSLGINNEFSFDAEMYEMAKCHIHAFDKAS
uniref:Methyltranfer_dom domain-containing protein n=1 Tax=Steinernema glaseri TaxID=37863 RepID=A0A1I7ZX50_9BILA